MPSAVPAVAAERGRSRPVGRRTHSVRSDLSLKPRAGSGKRITRYLFVNVDGLSVLAQVVQSGEPTRTVALEWPLTGMFARQLLACARFIPYTHPARTGYV